MGGTIASLLITLMLFSTVAKSNVKAELTGDLMSYEEILVTGLFSNISLFDKYTRGDYMFNRSNEVDIGLSLINIDYLDASKGILAADIWVRMVWHEYRLSWNPDDYGGVNILRMPYKAIPTWVPNAVIVNSVESNTPGVSNFTHTNVLIYPNSQVLWVPTANPRVSCSVDLRHFPFDVHTCHWKISIWGADGHSVNINFYNKKHSVDLTNLWTNSEWNVISTDLQIHNMSFPCCPNQHFQVLDGSVRIKRASGQYVLTLILPTFLGFLLLLMNFWLPPTSGEKITCGCFALIYLILLVVYMHWIVPRNGGGVPKVVIFGGTSIVFAGLSIIFSTVTINLSRNSHDSAAPSSLTALVTSVIGVILCLGEGRKGVSMGAKLLTSSNVELSVISDKAVSNQQDKFHDWFLVAIALDRIFFIIYFMVFFIMVISAIVN